MVKMLTDNLDMGNTKIASLSTYTNDVLSAANVSYVNSANADLTASLTNTFNNKINKSYISVVHINVVASYHRWILTVVLWKRKVHLKIWQRVFWQNISVLETRVKKHLSQNSSAIPEHCQLTEYLMNSSITKVRATESYM